MLHSPLTETDFPKSSYALASEAINFWRSWSSQSWPRLVTPAGPDRIPAMMTSSLGVIEHPRMFFPHAKA
jgi:hypothetical protein